MFEELKELIGFEGDLMELTNKLDVICGYSLLDYTNEEDYINNESITVSNQEEIYNLEFKIIKAGEKYLDYIVEVTDIYDI